MGVLLGDAVANFVVTISSIFLLTRLAIPSKLLSGLTVFKVLPVNQDKKAENKSPSPQRSGKQEKRLARQAARQQIHVEGAEQMVRHPLPSASIEGAHYYHELEYLVVGGIVVLLNFILVATPLAELKLASHKWSLWLGILFPLVAGWSILKVEFLTKAVVTKDKAFLAGLCAITSVAAVCMIDRMPLDVFDFQWSQAAREFNWTITTFLRKLAFSSAIPEVKLPFELLKIFLGLLAGLLSGLLAPGSVRLSKCLMLALSPPLPTKPHLTTGVFSAAIMQLAVVLPVLGALFWARPMVQELLGWSDAAVQIFRAIFMIVLAIVQLAAVRQFVQAYLNSGLVEWWTHKHAITAANANPRIGEFIRMKVDFVNMLVCKVGIEMLGPAAIWGSCGILLLYSVFKEGTQPAGWTLYGWPAYLSVKAPGEGPWVPTKLITAAAGFLGWWTCCCWFGFTALVLCMHRFGLLTA